MPILRVNSSQAVRGQDQAFPLEQTGKTLVATKKVRPQAEYVVGSYAAVAVAALVAHFWHAKDSDMFVAVEGLGAFTLFYVVAQAIERLLEPLVSTIATTDKTETSRDQAIVEGKAAEAKTAQEEIDQTKANRAVWIWALATVAAVVVAAGLHLYFLVAVGVQEDAVPDSVHILATALIVGGGTKPLHDLISRIQASEKKASEPTA